ncbi:polyketide synthase [Cavenderia fasciculata]|uniref:Polyketide synthase n=1 Tax=Cavenderia fasciculata TaxID=261658 RepID=F4QE67_CACFS|nr:polyketide synthase [Cavenderia fasciculata]EGG14014.1 polyketide synthase [Cavenderia fasciculata]|eukprot:XP_004350722.1 polyketide synthase [Cavenderia fasciculata]
MVFETSTLSTSEIKSTIQSITNHHNDLKVQVNGECLKNSLNIPVGLAQPTTPPSSPMPSPFINSASTTPLVSPLASMSVSDSHSPLSPLNNSSNMATAIVGIEPISAPHCKSQKDIMKLYESKVPEKAFLTNVYNNCKIRQRHFFYDIADLSITEAKTGERNQMFAKAITATIVEAAERVIKNTGIDRSQISHVVGVTSTGMLAPSIDATLIRELDLPDLAGRTMINFMGCGAAVIGLRTAYVHARARPNTYVLMVCVEASSINMDIDWSNRSHLVSSCIFSDGAVAALVSTQPRDQLQGRIEIVDEMSKLMKDSMSALHMHVGDRGIDLTLRPELASCITRNIKPAVTTFLANHKLTLQDIHFWAVHPGGRRILESVQEGLELPIEELADSYDIMKWYGNMVSCSALFVLKRIMNRIKSMEEESSNNGHSSTAIMDNGMIMAFSPGASIEAMLLKLIH